MSALGHTHLHYKHTAYRHTDLPSDIWIHIKAWKYIKSVTIFMRTPPSLGKCESRSRWYTKRSSRENNVTPGSSNASPGIWVKMGPSYHCTASKLCTNVCAAPVTPHSPLPLGVTACVPGCQSPQAGVKMFMYKKEYVTCTYVFQRDYEPEFMCIY